MAVDCNNTLAVREAVCKNATDMQEMITLGDDGTLTTNYGAKPVALMLKEKVDVTLSGYVASASNEADRAELAYQNTQNTYSDVQNYIDTLVLPAEATYNYETIDSKLNALAPYSGYLQVSKKLDNFYFQTSSNFIASMADKNRYVKFLEKRIETWSNTIQTTSTQTANATATTLTMLNTTGLTVGKVIAILKGDLLVHTSVITAVSTNVSITVLNSFNREVTAYKIKIVQSINLNDYVPDALVQDESLYGLTLQSSVNAGDYVVLDRKDLVTNGTFETVADGQIGHDNGDGTVDGYTQSNPFTSTASVISNEFVVVSTAPDSGRQLTPIVCVVGVTYLVKGQARVVSGTGTALIGVSDSLVGGTERGFKSTTNTETTDLYFSFTATQTTHYLTLGNGSSGTGSKAFDNISVKQQADETYRAKINAPNGTLLTNTTYFEARDSIGITNQIGVFHKYNVLTNSYEGLSAEILFSDVSKEDLLDNSVWLSRNGFKKVGEFCYAKDNDTYLYLPVSVEQLGNKGLYHQILNSKGAKKASDDLFWYNTAQTFTSLADCFKTAKLLTSSGNIASGKSGRPDGKYFDVLYSDRSQDVREYAKILNKWEVVLIRADKEKNGASETTFTEQVTQTTTGAVTTLEVSNGAYYKVGSVLQIWNGTTPYRRYVVSASGNTVTLDSTISKTAINFIISGGKTPSLESDKSSKSRLLGTPTNFPTIMTNRLAESKYIIGLDLQMVDDLGNNQLFDGVKDSFKLGDKFISILQSLRSTNSGSAYTTFTATNSTITNALTLTNEPTANIVLVSMTAKNNPYIQTAPKSVIEVLPKVIASNSHSIYKGALIGNQVSGKIKVGNGYESKVLENNSIGTATRNLVLGVAITDEYKIGEIFLAGYGFTNFIGGHYYEVTNTGFIGTPTAGWSSAGTKLLGANINQIPTHPTITLDNSNSPASKWFECLEEGNNGVLAGVYGKELAYNLGTTSYDGDNELFDQLYNGTKTDLNGAIVRTFHGSLPINGRIK